MPHGLRDKEVVALMWRLDGYLNEKQAVPALEVAKAIVARMAQLDGDIYIKSCDYLSVSLLKPSLSAAKRCRLSPMSGSDYVVLKEAFETLSVAFQRTGPLDAKHAVDCITEILYWMSVNTGKAPSVYDTPMDSGYGY
jgi:hypothetical protein